MANDAVILGLTVTDAQKVQAKVLTPAIAFGDALNQVKELRDTYPAYLVRVVLLD